MSLIAWEPGGPSKPISVAAAADPAEIVIAVKTPLRTPRRCR